MTLGTSPILDFSICLGLGVAAGACLLSTIIVLRLYSTSHNSKLKEWGLRVLTFLIFEGAIFAVAAIIGATKQLRNSNSTFGFVLGALIICPFIYKVYKNEKR